MIGRSVAKRLHKMCQAPTIAQAISSVMLVRCVCVCLTHFPGVSLKATTIYLSCVFTAVNLNTMLCGENPPRYWEHCLYFQNSSRRESMSR